MPTPPFKPPVDDEPISWPADIPTAPSEWTHGGWRPGAGRKRRARSVMHRTRPEHARKYPAHVTVPVIPSVARSLRQERVFKTLKAIFLAPKIAGFQVVHHSVQDDHIHLVVEAVDRAAFSSGMRSLTIRLALRLNRIFGRKAGQVVRDRYHRRDLFNGRQVRRVLVYVLLNGSKHRRVPLGQLDPFSSASTFDGWREQEDAASPLILQQARGPTPSARKPSPIRAWTRLLTTGWRDHGLISPYEATRWLTPSTS